MREAIERDLNKRMNYTYGQIWFDMPSLENGELLFERIILNEQLQNEQKAQDLLHQSISPEYLHPNFMFMYAQW